MLVNASSELPKGVVSARNGDNHAQADVDAFMHGRRI
jgi:hypothetical protein